jgi:hypothetical protein
MSTQMMQQQTSGRVTINANERMVDYARVQQGSGGLYGIEERVLRGRIQSTPVSQLFFSNSNIDALQLGLRNAVLNKTCGKVVVVVVVVT